MTTRGAGTCACQYHNWPHGRANCNHDDSRSKTNPGKPCEGVPLHRLLDVDCEKHLGSAKPAGTSRMRFEPGERRGGLRQCAIALGGRRL